MFVIATCRDAVVILLQKILKRAKMFKDYPKREKLKNGPEIILRPMVKDDFKALQEFFGRIPLEDRMFLKEDVSNPAVIASWIDSLDYSKVIPILAERNGKIIGDATLHRRSFGWLKHVGEIRLVIDANYRRRGLGLLLAREIFFLAIHLKLEKIMAEMMDTQHSAMKIFTTLGFKKEAELKNFVSALDGTKHNLVIMTHDVETLWDAMKNIISDTFADRSGEN